VHASDLAPSLIALEAQVSLCGAAGERSLPVEQFVVGPEWNIRRENVLADDEVLTAVTLPAPPAGWQGTYLKARERTAGDFPLVSVAVGFSLIEGRIHQPRLVLGGIAPVPWRSRDAEAVLAQHVPSPELATRATAVILAQAQPLAYNAFKIDIARALVPRAVMAVAAHHRAG
jgi:xanthine dehydrogenase YagS FAD-binding subunit